MNTDTWAVAVGIHFLLFPYHPLFYLKIRGEKEKEYLKNNQWPQINKRNSNYRKEVDEQYDKYCTKLKTQIPQGLVQVMSETINKGYENQNKRLSYKQWMNVIKKQIQPPTIIKFYADKQQTLSGYPVKLIWNVTGAKIILINGKDFSGTTQADFTPLKNEQYKIRVSNSAGAVEQTISVNVLPVPVISNFVADKQKIENGNAITLMWNISNVSKVVLEDGMRNIDVTLQNQYIAIPAQHTTYKLIVTALDNKTIIEQKIEIEVFPKPEIKLFEVSPNVVIASQPVSISWEVKNAKKIEIDNGVGEVSNSGAKKVLHDKNTLYQITAYGELSSVTKDIVVTVFPTPIIESLLVPMPDFESRINLNPIGSPKIDVSINIPDFNFNPPQFTKPDVNLDKIKPLYKPKVSIFNFSKIYERIKETIRL
ncbi:MAG: hypothetical protein LBL04_11250 [Bacteroidales bacterium]|nr:hypothetical protein [Bacteroidales bacterium]